MEQAVIQRKEHENAISHVGSKRVKLTGTEQNGQTKEWGRGDVDREVQRSSYAR
jgi:hypothetical protein